MAIKPWQNRSGYSLVSVLIAGVIGLIVALAAGGVISEVLKRNRGSAQNNEIETMVTSMYYALLSPAACQRTFFADEAGSPVQRALPSAASPFEISSIRNDTGGVLYSTGVTAGRGFRIVSMKVRPPRNLDPLVRASPSMARAQLFVTFEKNGSGAGNAITAERALPLCFNYDNSTGFLTGCGCAADWGHSQVKWILTQLGNCPAGQYLRGVQGNGQLICDVAVAPPPQVIPPPPLPPPPF